MGMNHDAWPPQGNDIIQICIASDQLEPNYIAAAQWRPQQVIILTTQTERIRKAAERLKAALELIGIPSKVIGSLPDSDPARLRDYALLLVTKLRELDQSIHLMLNATGGKKLMSMALSQAFERTENASVIYVDSDAHSLFTLHPWQADSFPMDKGLITIEAALALRGFRKYSSPSDSLDWRNDAIARNQLTNQMSMKLHDLRYLLRNMNRAATQDLSTLSNLPFYRGNDRPDKASQTILDRVSELGLADIGSSAQTISFRSEDSRRYLGGQWLEEYVWLAARKQTDAADCLSGIKVEHIENRALDNEIDLLLAVNNRLLMIECKTANLSTANKGNQALYKLDWLRQHLGGSHATSMLVSVRQLDPPVEKRARETRTLVLTRQAVMRIGEVIHRWGNNESVESLQRWVDTLNEPQH